MKICEVTALLEQEGTWVRRNMKTRDHLLFGDDQQEVTNRNMLGSEQRRDTGSSETKGQFHHNA